MSDQTKAAALTIAAQLVQPVEGEPPRRHADRIAALAARLLLSLDAAIDKQQSQREAA